MTVFKIIKIDSCFIEKEKYCIWITNIVLQLRKSIAIYIEKEQYIYLKKKHNKNLVQN